MTRYVNLDLHQAVLWAALEGNVALFGAIVDYGPVKMADFAQTFSAHEEVLRQKTYVVLYELVERGHGDMIHALLERYGFTPHVVLEIRAYQQAGTQRRQAHTAKIAEAVDTYGKRSEEVHALKIDREYLSDMFTGMSIYLPYEEEALSDYARACAAKNQMEGEKVLRDIEAALAAPEMSQFRLNFGEDAAQPVAPAEVTAEAAAELSEEKADRSGLRTMTRMMSFGSEPEPSAQERYLQELKHLEKRRLKAEAQLALATRQRLMVPVLEAWEAKVPKPEMVAEPVDA